MQNINEEYISKADLYKQVEVREELARNRVLDTPSSTPYAHNNNPAYSRYSAQLYERISFKHMVEGFEPADVAPVVHAHWIDEGQYADGHSEHAYRCSKCEEHLIGRVGEFDFCPYCGARMDGGK